MPQKLVRQVLLKISYSELKVAHFFLFSYESMCMFPWMHSNSNGKIFTAVQYFKMVSHHSRIYPQYKISQLFSYLHIFIINFVNIFMDNFQNFNSYIYTALLHIQMN
jgi:hypothetical protein